MTEGQKYSISAQKLIKLWSKLAFEKILSNFVTQIFRYLGMGNIYNWYAVYTKPRSEKKLSIRLQEKGIEVYLPLRKTLRQWSDRKKMVEEPLISSYVFVNVGKSLYHEVLNTEGAVKYIWFSGKPAIIPATQIELLKKITGSGVEVDCLPATLAVGTSVKVISGPLLGITGELIAIAGKHKMLVRIDHLDKVLTLSISPASLEEVM